VKVLETILAWENIYCKGIVRPDWIYMRVVPLDRPWKSFWFLNFTLEYLKRLQSSELLHTKINPTSCLSGSRFACRILSSYWLAHFYLMKKSAKLLCSILVWIAGCWNLHSKAVVQRTIDVSPALLEHGSTKKIAVSTCKPWSKQVGGWITFCMKRLRTFKSYQIFKIKIKNLKPIAVHVFFKAYPMVPLSCTSNLAGRYL
jgi:hypothetical protein